MNVSGADIAKHMASILILDDNFASVVSAVKFGRNIYDSVRKFIMFQLTVNVVVIASTFVSVFLLSEPLFSILQTLWLNLIMDSLAALALATEPPTNDFMKRPPYKKNDFILSPIMLKHIVG